MHKEALFCNMIVIVLVAMQFFMAWLFPRPSSSIGISVVSFMLGGAVIYFAGATSTKFVERGPDGSLDLFHLCKSTWTMLFAFAGFWFLINNFFVIGLNASPGGNLSVMIGLWVASSLLVPPVIEIVTNREKFLQTMNPLLWIGYGGILIFAAVLVYGQTQKQ